MQNEIVGKVSNLLQRPAPSESEVVHIMVLGRKLIEFRPREDRTHYSLVRFYCDWTVHHEIDRSGEGAQLLGVLHRILEKHLQSGDNAGYARDLTTALSLETARRQFNALLKRSNDGNGVVSIDSKQWTEIIPHLLEIISECPVTVRNDNSRLSRSIQSARAKPISGTAVIEQLVIKKVPSSKFRRSAPAGEFTYCIALITTNNIEVVTPFVKLR